MFTGRITFRRLLWVGPLAIVISLVVNLIIRAIALGVYKLSPAFSPMGIGPVAFWSIATGIGATLVFWLVGRYAHNPIPVFLIIAIIVYLATFYPDFYILFRNPPAFPDTSIATVGTLLLMHLVEAMITICILIMLGFDRSVQARPKHE